MGKKLLGGTIMKKNCRRQIKKGLESKKWLKEKETSYILNEKDMIKFLVVGLIKKDIVKWIYTKGVNTFLSHSNLLE